MHEIEEVTALTPVLFARIGEDKGKEMKEPVELLCDGVETVTEFS